MAGSCTGVNGNRIYIMTSHFFKLSVILAMTCVGAGFNSAVMAQDKSALQLNTAQSKNLTVLSYHEVVDAKNTLIPQYAVTTQQFKTHLDRKSVV